MEITKNGVDTMRGPSNWFTGAVYVDSVASPRNGSQASASSVHFTPGARTAWHVHPNGQTIYVTGGVGGPSVAGVRSRWSVPVTGCSSSRVRNTGTVPPPTGS